MTLERIQTDDSAEFKFCFELYQASFPAHEKRTWQDQVNALADDAYHYEVIKNDAKDILGILCTWKTAGFVYVEHFAILESARGKSVGSRALQLLIEETDLPIILEIDPPLDAISIRRKSFYERLGFVQNSYKYIHPSYRKDTHAHELTILSLPKLTDEIYESFCRYQKDTILQYTQSR